MIKINGIDTKIIIGIATMNSRKNSLHIVKICLDNQTIKPDKIIIYNNDEHEFNATDNGKFYYFTTEESKQEEFIFFSMDDDIYYSPTYIEDMIASLDIYGYNAIITHHGRTLRGTGLHYYRGHTSYACLHDNNYEGPIDIAGTGVTCFHSSYFKPTEVFYSQYKRMSDCVFSLEAAKQNKQIIVLKHVSGYFKDICDDVDNSCHRLESKAPTQQNLIADEIYKIKHNWLPKVSIIIPYKENRGYLTQAIDSITHQTYKGEIEIILSQSDNGVSYNLNRGIEKATGDYIKYLCDDDYLSQNSIELAINYFKENRHIQFIHGNAINFYEDNKKELYKPAIKNPTVKELLLMNHIHGGTLMYNKHIFNNFKFNEDLTTGEEYDFNLNLLFNNYKIGYVNEVLYYYRRHNNQKSIGNKNKEYQAERQKQIKLIKMKYIKK